MLKDCADFLGVDVDILVGETGLAGLEASFVSFMMGEPTMVAFEVFWNFLGVLTGEADFSLSKTRPGCLTKNSSSLSPDCCFFTGDETGFLVGEATPTLFPAAMTDNVACTGFSSSSSSSSKYLMVFRSLPLLRFVSRVPLSFSFTSSAFFASSGLAFTDDPCFAPFPNFDRARGDLLCTGDGSPAASVLFLFRLNSDSFSGGVVTPSEDVCKIFLLEVLEGVRSLSLHCSVDVLSWCNDEP